MTHLYGRDFRRARDLARISLRVAFRDRQSELGRGILNCGLRVRRTLFCGARECHDVGYDVEVIAG